jgi:hypothetical protein
MRTVLTLGDLLALRVVTDSDLSEKFARKLARVLGRKGTGCDSHAARTAVVGTILDDPTRAHSGPAGLAVAPQPITETREIMVPKDVVVLARRQGERGSGFNVESHYEIPRLL